MDVADLRPIEIPASSALAFAAVDENSPIKNVAVLIDGTQKPVRSAGDGNHTFIEVPAVLGRKPPGAESLRASRRELPSPLPDLFIRDDDPALQQPLLDQDAVQVNGRSDIRSPG